ncbi:MAG: ferritin family protein [Dehalococcoidia bacterium]|nr:MAG: ferritin family protein [Dehalococcoidia bacterium]
MENIIHCTLSEILDRAIQKEIESQLLYLDLNQKMIEKIARDTFMDLARQEQEHQYILEQYQQGGIKSGVLDKEKVIDYEIVEHFDQPEITSDMQLKDVYLMAATREKISHEFYLALASIHPAGNAKKLLNKLASQELEHKHKLEFLYTEVAFPQTAGG